MENENNDISDVNNNDINNTNNDIDSSNIFDEFAENSTLIDEVDKIKKDRNKDLFYYFSKVGHIFQTIFIFWIIVIVILFSYITIQNDETFSNSNILDPFCFIFLWNIDPWTTYCSSISYVKNASDVKLANIKKTHLSSILGMLEKLYEVENFTKTKDVMFIADKSNNKLRVLSIIEEFDNLKNEFDKIDKQKIQCKNIIIDSKKSIISLNCFAYSAWFEKWLRWFDWTNEATLKWTSLSIANSFINFISNKSEIFSIIDRQKMFKSESIVWEKTDFTNKTTFTLKLNYNLK